MEEMPSGSRTRRIRLWGGRFTWGQKLAFALCVNVFTAFTVLFFSPMEVYLGNILEFDFPLANVWWILLLLSVGIAAAVSAVEMLLPELVFLVVNLAGFGLGLCCYVQAMFLNGQMGTLTGTTDVYSGGLVAGNLVVWALIVAAVYIFVGVMAKVKKRRTAVYGLIFVSMALVAMQTVALVSQLIGTAGTARRQTAYLSGEGEFTLASDVNVVEFIVDTCDVKYFEQAREQYPDITEGLSGFTYYPNATSTHSRTYPSVTYMLTGKACRFDKPMTQYVDEAWQNGGFIPALRQTGCDVRVFTEQPYVSDEAMVGLLDNGSSFEQGSLSYISVRGLVAQMTKIALYRELPYYVKWRFAYDGGKINRAVMRYPTPMVEEHDAYFYKRLTGEDRLSVSGDYDKAFRFYHFSGAHPGEHLGADAKVSETADRAAAIRGNFRIIQEYLQQMKDLGLYEHATVIITADHGSSGSTDHSSADNLQAAYPYRPIMLVKPAGAGADAPFTESTAPVCHDDLFATVLTGAGGDAAAFGRPVWDIPQDEARARYYYFTAMYSDANGEVALREYRIDGDAGNFDNWSLTGQYWDINYSERAVSRHRLAELGEA